MREIKFKVKIKLNHVGDYHYKGKANFIESRVHEVCSIGFKSPSLTIMDECGYSVVIQKEHCEIFELMQFTGLKDKNGLEIYEGDILINDLYPFKDNGINNYIGLVTWIFSSWQIVLKCVNSLKSGISSGINHDLSEYIGDSDVLNFEVIGNIHSNLEILK